MYTWNFITCVFVNQVENSFQNKKHWTENNFDFCFNNDYISFSGNNA